MKLIRCTLAAAVVAAFAAPMVASAATGTATGAGNISATADLTFQVTIPRFLMIRVGSAAAVNTLAYAPTVSDITTPTGVLATGGDVGGGNDVTYRFLGNAGNMTLSASNLANLVSGSGNIPTSTLSGVAQTGSVAPPAFNGSVALLAASGIVNQSGTWRYTWTNPANTVYPADSYSGTVTYTLSAP